MKLVHYRFAVCIPDKFLKVCYKGIGGSLIFVRFFHQTTISSDYHKAQPRTTLRTVFAENEQTVIAKD